MTPQFCPGQAWVSEKRRKPFKTHGLGDFGGAKSFAGWRRKKEKKSGKEKKKQVGGVGLDGQVPSPKAGGFGGASISGDLDTMSPDEVFSVQRSPLFGVQECSYVCFMFKVRSLLLCSRVLL